jgi:hypothetical protein
MHCGLEGTENKETEHAAVPNVAMQNTDFHDTRMVSLNEFANSRIRLSHQLQ